ncbi:DNA-binding protein P3A2-like [Physella acuta]|uniref:DNA-binding protein P3A2-like n=1 Tax=Physella acuta TaxID=109671 RepID=UPI0027DE2135|nr:DNA-binding protein P3A2-like [Physella acuta]XP_059161390.1 DNA-binding protein P3A2-like [Physella acuta]XP_059161391.1 DNA-binding protein P3A2-like [Physella acuta]XP_059161392.1 DNA-binding protein P3A2-like [Physella acuta]XP_059161393.1 DNA-binding protein P3A2-like [Physella acuta]
MMNSGLGNGVHGGMAGGIAHINHSMMEDDLSDGPSSPESAFDASDLMHSSMADEVTAQLAAAGPVGIAAAAAIATGKKKGHPHQFETNPSRRKRQQTRLLRKLKNTIEEYTTRVGQQAVVLCCTPGRTPGTASSLYKVFGSQPLENVIRNCRSMVTQELESALQEQAAQHQGDTTHLHELPPLVIDGIPTPIDKMTQAQLRNFIPEMLKYSTCRSKPGWGKPECRPPWWPADLPWANVRSDARTDKRVSWTEALRTIVKDCYKHHGREDLLHVFSEESTTPSVQTNAQFAGTMLQTINNPDGTVSIIQLDTGPSGNSVFTLPDGTQATVVHAVSAGPHHVNMTVWNSQLKEASQAVQTLAEVAANQQEVTPVTQVNSVEMADGHTAMQAFTTATFNQNGQLILSGDGSLGALQGIVTIPASMYQQMTGLTLPESAQQVTMASVGNLKTEISEVLHGVEVTSSDGHLKTEIEVLQGVDHQQLS